MRNEDLQDLLIEIKRQLSYEYLYMDDERKKNVHGQWNQKLYKAINEALDNL